MPWGMVGVPPRPGFVRSRYIALTANVGAGGSFDPALTLSAGAPTPMWTIIDGAGVTVWTGASITHVQTGAGDMQVTLGPASLYPYITALDANTDGLKGTLTVGSFLGRLPNLTSLTLRTNASLVCSWRLADLPAGMTYLSLYSTASTITGSLANLPAGMTYLNLGSTASTITGSLANLPAGMTVLSLYSTASTITGSLANLPAGMTHLNLDSTASTITGSLANLPAGMTYLNLGSTASTITGGATAPVTLQNVQLQSTGRSQAQVDEIVNCIYQRRAAFTFATPILNVGGTNAAPSGAYADEDPPVTGKGMIYELVVDPEIEGFRKWTITYTA